jgi:hypothetical protein
LDEKTYSVEELIDRIREYNINKKTPLPNSTPVDSKQINSSSGSKEVKNSNEKLNLQMIEKAKEKVKNASELLGLYFVDPSKAKEAIKILFGGDDSEVIKKIQEKL